MKSAPEYAESAELALQAAEKITDARTGLRFLDSTDKATIAHHHRRAEIFATLALAAATHRPVRR